MTDIRNTDLITEDKTLKEDTAALTLGDQVPAGMKRFHTFLSVQGAYVAGGASQVAVYVASVSVSNPTKASIIATGNRKLLLHLRATQTSGFRKGILTVPKSPSTETPLFSIAGGNWCGVYASKTTANVSTQYFEE